MAEPRIPDTDNDGWKAAEQALFELMLAATPAQRLAWLEEMIVVAHKSGALPRRDQSTAPRPTD